MAAEFWEEGKSESCPIYDMHGHMGTWKGIYFPCAEAPDMVHVMERAGVKLLCFAHHHALFAPDVGNDPAIEAVRQFPDRLRAYMAINPNYPDIVKRDLDRFDSLRDVFMGLKFLAGYHEVKMSDDRYKPALEFANARKLPVLMHTWQGCEHNDAAQVRHVASHYPDALFFLGHCLGGDWTNACAITKEYPNTYLELTSVPGARGALEFLVEGAGSDRILFGTDLPWFEEHQSMGSLLSADITEADIHNICHRNAEKILGVKAGG